MPNDNLLTTVKQLLSPGKGLLAADETVKTTDKRFALIQLENNDVTRREFREMLLTAKGLEQYISGVILFDGTIRDSVDGKSFVDILKEEKILSGIKVDQGLSPTPNGENVTLGIADLDARLKEYVRLGATFCKWRSLFLVGSATLTPIKSGPTDENILTNAQGMTQYALLCQQNGLVPIVEPEILMDGDHTREEAGAVSEKVLTVLFNELAKENVYLPGLILKTSMVLKGKESTQPETSQDIAQATLEVFKKVLPNNLGGVVFLSGGQSELQATENLQAIRTLDSLLFPVTFSYSRALEEGAIKVWQGKRENIPTAQAVLLHRAEMNSLASLGKYTPDLENN